MNECKHGGLKTNQYQLVRDQNQRLVRDQIERPRATTEQCQRERERESTEGGDEVGASVRGIDEDWWRGSRKLGRFERDLHLNWELGGSQGEIHIRQV